MEAAFERRRDVLAQGSAGRLPPERWKAERTAYGKELSSIWRSEALTSNDYVKAKLVAAALLTAGKPSENRFAEDVHEEAARRCPDKASDHDAVVSAAMTIVPLLANDSGRQPTRTDTSQPAHR